MDSTHELAEVELGPLKLDLTVHEHTRQASREDGGQFWRRFTFVADITTPNGQIHRVQQVVVTQEPMDTLDLEGDLL